MPTFLDIILYEESILKHGENKNKLENKNKPENNKINFKENEIKNKFEENKKNILDSFVNYPRLELIKKYKIQIYQFLMNRNYRVTFLKILIVPTLFNLFYNSKYKCKI